jgi:hypothetical protein
LALSALGDGEAGEPQERDWILGQALALRRGIETESSEAATVTYPAIPPVLSTAM